MTKPKSQSDYNGRGIWYESKGYACVDIDGRTCKVHILVWESANGKKPDGYEIHHIDGNKTNFDLRNLELLSRSDHQRVHAGWVRDTTGNWIAKPCTECESILPLNAFYPRGLNRTPSAKCRECHKAACTTYNTKHYQQNKHKWQERYVLSKSI